MMSTMEATSIMALKYNKCCHQESKSLMSALPNRLIVLTELFELYHEEVNRKTFTITVKCKTDFTSIIHRLDRETCENESVCLSIVKM